MRNETPGLPSRMLVRRLASAQRVVVLTGAGVSAESGIPTFRDPGGIWERFRPEELANVDAFLRNPSLVQGWYRHRQDVARRCKPNPAHFALRDLEQLVPSFALVTQNVDGLHERAGSRNILELHGNIMRSYCIECRSPAVVELDPDGDPVRCGSCGGLIRPDVVWFGEALPSEVLEAAYAASEAADVFLSVGTSAIVYPAAGLPAVALDAGAYVAEFNLEPSALAHDLHEVVLGRAGETLPDLVGAVRAERETGTSASL